MGNWVAVWHSPVDLDGTIGEDCAVTRLFLDKTVHDQFMEKLIDYSRQIKLGNPMEESTTMGPIVSTVQQEKVAGYLAVGEQDGATVAYRGEAPADPACAGGNFFPPTIFENVTNDMRIAQEEIFGPVLSVIDFDDPREAVRQANQTDFGLAAAVWSQDITKAHAIARELRAGTIWVNGVGGGDVNTPWGGYKQSGIGRERGAFSIDLYTEVKAVHINLKGYDQVVPNGA